MNRVYSFLVLLKRLFQELSDESPYRRHLEAHQLRHSRQEWQRFLDQRLRHKYIRPRCC